MMTTPEKSTRVTSEHLNLPVGISVSWEKSLPFRVITKIIEIAKDEELVQKDFIFNTLPCTQKTAKPTEI